MHHEFCQLTALAIPYEQYINQIEPLYMNSPLQKQEFCKNWVEQHNDNINNLKTIKKDIIVDIKQIISFRKEFNAEVKTLIKGFGGNLDTLSKHMYNYYLNQYNHIVSQYHNDQMFWFIYKDGSQLIFNAEEVLTGEVKYINYSNIVFAHCRTGYDEYDTEIGNHEWQGDTDEQFEAREKYFSNIEIKYKTKWGLKQAGLI